MTQRLNYIHNAGESFRALDAVRVQVAKSNLSGKLLEFAYLRTSLINGCAYCIDAHSQDLLKAGVPLGTLLMVPVWREAGPLFDERERAALAWAETVTRAAETGVPQAQFDAARAVFAEAELAELTIAIGLMNAFNRIAISFRTAPLAIRRAAA